MPPPRPRPNRRSTLPRSRRAGVLAAIALAACVAACSSDEAAPGDRAPGAESSAPEPSARETGSPASAPGPAAAPTAPVTTDTTGTTDTTEPARGRPGEDVDWTSCADTTATATTGAIGDTAEDTAGIDCGNVRVPLDHEAPERGRIDIAIARLPAQTADRDGVIVLNPGGPGYSGVDFLVEEGPDLVERLGLERFDLVGFDPRGVARSGEIQCIDTPLTVQQAFADTTPDDDSERAAWELGARDLVRECVREYGDTLPLYGTEAAARDLDLIRTALGVERITPLMMSYGTFLAATYATLFPDRVEAMVLDAPTELPGDLTASVIVHASATERALERWSTWCTSTFTCELNDDDPLAVWDQVELLLEAGATTDDGRPVAVGRFWQATYWLLRIGDEQGWERLASMLSASVRGYHDELVVISDALFDIEADDAEFASFDSLTVIRCASGLGSGSVLVDDTTSMEVLASQAPRMGPLFVAPLDPCATLAPGASPAPLRPVDTPVLVIDSVGDLRTPPVWADRMMALYGPPARRVTYLGEGHVKVGSSECVEAAVAAFLDDPASFPALTTCEAGT